MGSENTQKLARSLSFNDWLLDMILSDCETLLENNDLLIFGRGGSHVWVSRADNNERIMFITSK